MRTALGRWDKEERSMVSMRALIDDRRYFNRIEYYYRMFSHDLTYYADSRNS
jgi:hypothetical protein